MENPNITLEVKKAPLVGQGEFSREFDSQNLVEPKHPTPHSNAEEKADSEIDFKEARRGIEESLARKEEEKKAYFLDVAKKIASANSHSFSELGYSIHRTYQG